MLFYAWRLGNRVPCTMISIFLLRFLATQLHDIKFPKVMKKRQLTSVRSLKIHHVLAFFAGFFLCTKHNPKFASPLTHTWLIESEDLLCPYHLVIIERVE